MGFKKTFFVFILIIITGVFLYKPFSGFFYAQFSTALVFNDRTEYSNGNKFPIPDWANSSIVSVQSFKGGQLLKSGGGLVMTQDGLIVTLNSLIPLEAEFYQIIVDGKFDRGRVVARDYKTNLAMIALDESGISPIDFYDISTTQEQLYVANQTRELDRSNLVIIQPTDNNFYLIDPKFAGGAVFNSKGEAVGIANPDSKLNQVITSASIKEFFSKYVLKK